MEATDGKARARAAYAKVDAELRSQRWRLLGAAIVAIALGALLFLLAWALREPFGASRLVQGTAAGTRQIQDDEEHIVVLLVKLDAGETIRLSPHEVVPIGARVVVKEGKNWFGEPIYEYGGLSPTRAK